MHELDELRRANPMSLASARNHLRAERSAFLDARELQGWDLDESATADFEPEVRLLPWRMSNIALAGAAVIVACIALFIGDPFQERSVIEASVAAPVTNGELVVQSAERGFDRSSDLLVLHFDFAAQNDSHDVAAAFEVAGWFDLDPLVVAGTQDSRLGEAVPGYAGVMDAVFDRGWLDAGADRSLALHESAERWLHTLDANGQVWVAEGGVSDFTAEVVNEILRRRPEMDAQRQIHVVQHSAAREQSTNRDAMAVLRAQTSYRRVDSGELENGTGDFRGESDGFEAAVTRGAHAAQWRAAFAFAPTAELNFSDVVVLLEVLNVSVDHVANASDFAAFFIGDQPDAALRGES